MDHHSTAADGSRIALAVEGIAAEVRRLAEAAEKLAADTRLLTRDLEKRSSRVPGLPRLAYSREEAADVCGMEVKTIDHLIRTGRLPCVKVGSQRGRVILHEDLENFLRNHRQATVEEFLGERRDA
jgi:hypothetical protein